MSLSADERSRYTSLIDSILSTSDLTTVSAKKVRKSIQATVTHDISDQKKVINDLIKERFEHIEQQQQVKKESKVKKESTPPVNVKGHASASESELSPAPTESTPQPKKKVKREASEDSDAAFAARLQAEEDSRSRSTRGSATRKRKPVKAATSARKKAKSATKITSKDDSDVETGDGGEPKEKKGAFHKPYALSETLTAVVGETRLSRPQVVKNIWVYIRANDLQKEGDKRQIICDDKLQALFKQKQVSMFSMNKYISAHLFPIEEGAIKDEDDEDDEDEDGDAKNGANDDADDELRNKIKNEVNHEAVKKEADNDAIEEESEEA